MRFLTKKLHGFVDYGAAAVLIFAPFALDFWSREPLAFVISAAAGVALAGYSLFTDYYLSLTKTIPFAVHILLDGAAAIALFVVSLMVFGFDSTIQTFFLVMAVAILIVDGLSLQAIQAETPQAAPADDGEVLTFGRESND